MWRMVVDDGGLDGFFLGKVLPYRGYAVKPLATENCNRYNRFKRDGEHIERGWKTGRKMELRNVCEGEAEMEGTWNINRVNTLHTEINRQSNTNTNSNRIWCMCFAEHSFRCLCVCIRPQSGCHFALSISYYTTVNLLFWIFAWRTVPFAISVSNGMQTAGFDI